MKKGKFFPTEDNANKIETWNATGGHVPTVCNDTVGFSLGDCAVNCYTQWFAGAAACPRHRLTAREQSRVAKAKLLRYNLVIVLERLRDPDYAAAVEKFFGVPGVTARRSAACVRLSRQANRAVPLRIKNETMKRLIDLNEVDIGLYKELTDCEGSEYGFPEFAPNRFAAVSVEAPH